MEEKFDVTSVDASDKMLKYALKTRWARRKEPLFDNWGKSLPGESELPFFFFAIPSAKKVVVSEAASTFID